MGTTFRLTRTTWLLIALALRAVASLAAQAPVDVALWTYYVRLSEAGDKLNITAEFVDVEPSFTISGNPELAGLVTASTGHKFVGLTFEEGHWLMPKGQRGDWKVQYSYDLADAAKVYETVVKADGKSACVLIPALWLLRPAVVSGTARVRIETKAPEGMKIVMGARPSADGKAYEMPASMIAELPYAAFGHLRTTTVDAPGVQVDVAFMPSTMTLSDDDLKTWIGAAATTVARWFGKFPVSRTLIIVKPSDDEGVGAGTTVGLAGSAILLPIGKKAEAKHLTEDWILVHEMIHLAFPNVPPSHRFLEEGLATYLEPVVRAASGQLSVKQVWSDWLRDMPQGEAKKDGDGLVGADDQARVYWGGAAFWMTVDVRLRARTGNKKSLRDILLALHAEGLTIESATDIKRLVPIAQKATGTSVFGDLYEDFRARPKRFEFDRLWEELGVKASGDSAIFDDKADLAAIRAALLN